MIDEARAVIGELGLGTSRALVYDVIWRLGPVARGEVAAQTGLTKSTISVLADELTSIGLIEEIGYRASGAGGGRRAALLRVRADSHVVAAIHVGVITTTVVLADALGKEIAARAFNTPRRDPESALASTARVIRELVADQGQGLQTLMSIGVAVPGLIDDARGVCRLAPNLGWRDVQVAQILRSHIDVDVHVHNTVQAMTVAEAAQMGESGNLSLAMLYVGTGVGAAVIEKGLLLRGAGGFAGEIGHMNVVGNARECGCGRTGCLETLVSGSGIARRAVELGIVNSRSKKASAPQMVGAAADAGDPVARALVTSVGEELGRAASLIVQIANPQSLVISGSISSMGDLLLEPLRETVAALTLPELHDSLEIRRSLLDNRGKLRGAVLIALKRLSAVSPR